MKCEHLHVFDTIDLLITNYCPVSALTVSTASLRYEAYAIDKIITIMLFYCVKIYNIHVIMIVKFVSLNVQASF